MPLTEQERELVARVLNSPEGQAIILAEVEAQKKPLDRTVWRTITGRDFIMGGVVTYVILGLAKSYYDYRGRARKTGKAAEKKSKTGTVLNDLIPLI